MLYFVSDNGSKLERQLFSCSLPCNLFRYPCMAAYVVVQYSFTYQLDICCEYKLKTREVRP